MRGSCSATIRAAGVLAEDLHAQGVESSEAAQIAACWAHTATVILWCERLDLLPARISAGRELTGAVRAGSEDLAAHPATAGFADPAANPAMRATPGPAALAALDDALTASPDHGWDTWTVGDLYQELSAEARKERALAQTPRFIAYPLVDWTVERVMLELGDGAKNIRVIDPACGTGHLLVAAVRKVRHLPHRMGMLRADRAVDAVRGIDLDPYAALIARWRLAVECLPYSRPAIWGGLDPDLPIHVAAADSLLDTHPLLKPGQYHAVVANPPYITVKDAGQREAIRSRYRDVCHGKYSLAVPFMPLLHRLAVPGGWVGQLTANSWMKREFGKPLIERYLPTIDLRWVIDTSGAYIPGHGTPTCILISRNRPPVGDKVRTVLGVRGEPSKPADPARGAVWTAIEEAVERAERAERYQQIYEWDLRQAAARGDARAAQALAVIAAPDGALTRQNAATEQQLIWDAIPGRAA